MADQLIETQDFVVGTEALTRMPVWDRGIEQQQPAEPATTDPRTIEATETADRIASGTRWATGLDWPIAIWIALIHVGALAAPWFFSWQGLVVAVFWAWLTGSVGVCMGYHRHLTHLSFRTYRPIRWLLALIGGLSGEGSALTWIANHRKHHAYSDHDGDPHAPRDGGIWSHMLWFCPNFGSEHYKTLTKRYAPDLLRDPVMVFLHKAFLASHVVLGCIMMALGTLIWDWQIGVSMVIWGMFVRLVYVLHVTWGVNSASHIWGYQTYDTRDNSRNNWWIGLLAFGEGWHNNHHAYPRVAAQGHRWWEFDLTYLEILLLEKLGLVWDVVRKPKRQAEAVEE